MLYMKGTPQQPQCGFSQQVCRVLHATGVEFDSVNAGVEDDESIREGVKLYSSGRRSPGAVGGEFVRGLRQCQRGTATSSKRRGRGLRLLPERAMAFWWGRALGRRSSVDGRAVAAKKQGSTPVTQGLCDGGGGVGIFKREEPVPSVRTRRWEAALPPREPSQSRHPAPK